MLTFDQALQVLINNIQPLAARTLPLIEAHALVLSSSVSALCDMPRWDNSAMDGFAFDSESFAGSGTLKITGRSFAGHPYNSRLQVGEAVQITTGAILPEGADSVVPLEDTESTGDQLLVNKNVIRGQHVRYLGEEFRAGEELLAAGTRLNAGEIGLLASAGVARVDVVPKPKVAVFSTGDELVELGQELGPGQIVNSNLQYLIARISECGCIPIPLGIGHDDTGDLNKLLDQGLEADLLLSTGGVSVGEKDMVQKTLLVRGFKRKFWKVAIKPGKPVLFGLLNDKPFLGLPGNPAATAATYELFVYPALRRLAGWAAPCLPRLRATLTDDVKGDGKRKSFLWGRIEIRAGRPFFEPSFHQGSGQHRSTQGAQALLSIEIASPELTAGSEVDVFVLRLPPSES